MVKIVKLCTSVSCKYLQIFKLRWLNLISCCATMRVEVCITQVNDLNLMFKVSGCQSLQFSFWQDFNKYSQIWGWGTYAQNRMSFADISRSQKVKLYTLYYGQYLGIIEASIIKDVVLLYKCKNMGYLRDGWFWPTFQGQIV